jgi:MFS transporter, DHA2 family, multidrug resistance protein
MTTPHPPVRAGRREWIGLAVIALPCLLYSMDLTVLYLAVPSLTADLEPSSSELLWITDIYGFFLAGFLITMGTLGDRIGRRRLLLIGAVAFGAMSVLAAISTSVEMLIVSRALLGIAAATLAPSTLSLIRNMFLDPEQRTFAIGVWATSFSVGAAIGPLLGGLLLEFFWWGSVFLLAVPVMAVLLVLGRFLSSEIHMPAAWISSAQGCQSSRCWRLSTGSSALPRAGSTRRPYSPSLLAWPLRSCSCAGSKCSAIP